MSRPVQNARGLASKSARNAWPSDVVILFLGMISRSVSLFGLVGMIKVWRQFGFDIKELLDKDAVQHSTGTGSQH